ncbi:hypothetical protein NUW54_g2422 [Trametes sanguinea]|uniref:Uncharacterized protein n=1 Tax=Trametes sanguinea TaxID=158606 RepID=A0ACC1Q5H6_9APHY|nr:hypothetical protein NUW54_g2422 [Trametes sanguinea]
MHHLFACIAGIKRGTHIHNGASTTSSLTIGFPNIELTDIPSLKSIDPLIVIVEIRRMDIQSLCSLSTTCRVLREASMPLLFYTTRSRTASGHAGPDHAQWKHRTLHILDDCLDEPFKTRVAGELVLHSLSCGLYDPLFLGNALRKMPALAKVEVGLMLAFERRQLTPHELPWATVQAILSVPHLQCFTVDSHRLTPWMLPGESYRPDALSPGLTAFQYRLVYYHEYLRYTPEEQAFKVTLILKTYHSTLQKLELPIALLPIPALHSLQWPVLHELRFHSGQEPGKAHLVSSALVNMAALRVLGRGLAERLEGVECRARLVRFVSYAGCSPFWVYGVPALPVGLGATSHCTTNHHARTSFFSLARIRLARTFPTYLARSPPDAPPSPLSARARLV